MNILLSPYYTKQEFNYSTKWQIEIRKCVHYPVFQKIKIATSPGSISSLIYLLNIFLVHCYLNLSHYLRARIYTHIQILMNMITRISDELVNTAKTFVFIMCGKIIMIATTIDNKRKCDKTQNKHKFKEKKNFRLHCVYGLWNRH